MHTMPSRHSDASMLRFLLSTILTSQDKYASFLVVLNPHCGTGGTASGQKMHVKPSRITLATVAPHVSQNSEAIAPPGTTNLSGDRFLAQRRLADSTALRIITLECPFRPTWYTWVQRETAAGLTIAWTKGRLKSNPA
jgi:hypothetical protein